MPAKKDKRATLVDIGKLNVVPSSDATEKASSPNFIVEFAQLCGEEGVIDVPKIGNVLELTSSVINVEKPSSYSMGPSKSTEQAEEPPQPPPPPPPPTTVFVAYEFQDRPETLRQLIFKGLVLETGMITALKRCAPSFAALSNLKLENCSMTSDMLQDLTELLVNNKNICDLSLDMNPIPEQNYYALFQQDTRLRFLSLRLCSLNDDGIELLSKELGFKDSGQTLIYLNLNHNHLTCKGARHLANALRTNRTLAVILLAGNYIGDEGAIALAEVFQQFPLTHEEVVMRRRRNLRRLMQRSLQTEGSYSSNLERKNRQSKAGILTIKDGAVKSSSAKKKDKETKSGGAREKKKGKEPKGATGSTLPTTATLSALSEYPTSRRLSKLGVSSEQRRLEQIADQETEPDLHPYMNDAKQFDGEVWCLGNTKLAHLNLSHNRIGNEGVNQFFKTLQYQEDTFQQNKGLITVLLQGNPITECPELHGLLELLGARYSRMDNSSSLNPSSTSGYNTSPVNISKQGNK